MVSSMGCDTVSCNRVLLEDQRLVIQLIQQKIEDDTVSA